MWYTRTQMGRVNSSNPNNSVNSWKDSNTLKALLGQYCERTNATGCNFFVCRSQSNTLDGDTHLMYLIKQYMHMYLPYYNNKTGNHNIRSDHKEEVGASGGAWMELIWILRKKRWHIIIILLLFNHWRWDYFPFHHHHYYRVLILLLLQITLSYRHQIRIK